MGMIRGNADLGFCADATAGSGFMGMIRGNVDLGFCAVAAVRSGFMGMIRENVDLGFGVAVAVRRSGTLTRAPSATLRAAKLVCRSAAPKQIGDVISRFAPRGDPVGRDGHSGRLRLKSVD
jgi:hypothetical protein